MKSLRTSVFLLATLLAVGTLPSLAQSSEKLSTADAVQAVVERHHGLTEDLTEDISAKSNIVHVVARHADGSVFYDYTTHNVRTTGGTDWQGNAMVCCLWSTSSRKLHCADQRCDRAGGWRLHGWFVYLHADLGDYDQRSRASAGYLRASEWQLHTRIREQLQDAEEAAQ